MSAKDQKNTENNQLKLFDTMSRTIKPIFAKDGKQLRFYCCGPTVYGPAHIGNFRTFLLQDVMRRVVELTGLPTKHVRNITDVDDKTIRDSQAAGVSLNEFTKKWYEKLTADSEALGSLAPHLEPSAVKHIPEQIQLIQDLIDKNVAYATEDGSVYYNVANWENYGRLSRVKDREITTKTDARSDDDEYESKESLVDFALWKGRKPEDGENYWDSPWGQGRPGWHTECSAMSVKYLGKNFDLHSGGVDLIFPHHENEIAQCEACNNETFADHWYHIEHLMVDGGKMSKSLGNMYTLEDLEIKGFSAAEVRYVLVSGHYRQQLNFTLNSLSAARQALNKLSRFAQVLNALVQFSLPTQFKKIVNKRIAGGQWKYFGSAWGALLMDLNTPKALGQLFAEIKNIEKAIAQKSMSDDELKAAGIEFQHIVGALGLIVPEPEEVDVPVDIQELADKRWQFRLFKDWEASDKLRAELKDLGWHVKDGRDGFQMVPLPGIMDHDEVDN